MVVLFVDNVSYTYGLSQGTGESSADFSGLKIIVLDWTPNPEDLLAVR